MRLTTLLLAVCLTWHQTRAQLAGCDSFSAGLCPIEEDNIVDSNMSISSPEECQVLCQ